MQLGLGKMLPDALITSHPATKPFFNGDEKVTVLEQMETWEPTELYALAIVIEELGPTKLGLYPMITVPSALEPGKVICMQLTIWDLIKAQNHFTP